jgi:hypothetical protein
MIEPVARPKDSRGWPVNEDRGLGAMPKLYGAPAYARPPAIPVAPVDRPTDPDDMPLESERTLEDPESMGHPQPRSYEAVATAEPLPAESDASTRLHGRPFRLRIPGRNSNGE